MLRGDDVSVTWDFGDGSPPVSKPFDGEIYFRILTSAIIGNTLIAENKTFLIIITFVIGFDFHIS